MKGKKKYGNPKKSGGTPKRIQRAADKTYAKAAKLEARGHKRMNRAQKKSQGTATRGTRGRVSKAMQDFRNSDLIYGRNITALASPKARQKRSAKLKKVKSKK